MANINMPHEADGANEYPSTRYGQRERKLIKDLLAYIDAGDLNLQNQLGPLLPGDGYGATLLGASSNFTVLGDTGVTNSVGATTIDGDVGSITGGVNGFPPGIISNGSEHENDAAAIAALAAYQAAKTTVSGLGYSTDRTATPDLANQMLFPGVYKFDAAASISAGSVTLNANGNQNAQFIFNIGTTLTTAASVSIILTNGAQADNVIWNVGTGATLGASNTFKGNIWAGTTVVLGSATNVGGRIFADTAVTLDTNVIAVPA